MTWGGYKLEAVLEPYSHLPLLLSSPVPPPTAFTRFYLLLSAFICCSLLLPATLCFYLPLSAFICRALLASSLWLLQDGLLQCHSGGPVASSPANVKHMCVFLLFPSPPSLYPLLVYRYECLSLSLLFTAFIASLLVMNIHPFPFSSLYSLLFYW